MRAWVGGRVGACVEGDGALRVGGGSRSTLHSLFNERRNAERCAAAAAPIPSS